MTAPVSQTLSSVADEVLADADGLLALVLDEIATALPELTTEPRVAALLAATVQDTVLAALAAVRVSCAVDRGADMYVEAGLVVVGGSLAGLRAVESARRAGYGGPVTLVGAEEHLPYDGPPLSKAYLTRADAVRPSFGSAGALADLGVELRLGQRARGLDLTSREVLLGDGAVPFDSLVIATGSVPSALPGTGGLAGVHTLRTVEDAQALRAHVSARSRTVIVGGGFIGAEIATALRARDAEVTIVEAAGVPLVRAVGEQMAGRLAALHERNGVALGCATTVRGIDAATGTKRVELSDGTVLDADLVVVGIGARPATGCRFTNTMSAGERRTSARPCVRRWVHDAISAQFVEISGAERTQPCIPSVWRLCARCWRVRAGASGVNASHTTSAQ